VPRLIVIKGTDEGRQFVLDADVVTAGRDSSSRVRLTDTEASRRHAEFLRTPAGYRLRDVGSANGTFVNNQSIRDVLLQAGDHIQIGQTILVYTLERGETAPGSDLADRISLITRQDAEPLSSAIIKAIGEAEGSRIMAHPEQVDGSWLRNAKILGTLYEAIQIISHTLDIQQLLERLLELVFEAVGADRGCILLRSAEIDREDSPPVSAAEFEPRAVLCRDEGNQKQRLSISRTIIEHVLRQRQGILVSDVLRDERFGAAQSIVRSGIREILCVPMKGRHQTLGVLYLDTSMPATALAAGRLTGKFTEHHLSLAIAIAHQAALAVEETRYYQAMLNAERLAAVGQTVAALSHDLKNILQGLGLGGSILEQGIRTNDRELLEKGWRILSRNQGRIHDLVLNMLSYSKEREPVLEPTCLNTLSSEVVELLAGRAEEKGVQLQLCLDETLSKISADPDALHRALLNIVSNALDAVAESESPRVVVRTKREPGEPDGKEAWVRIEVEDNGTGIAPEKLGELFRPFVSTKGARGTGLGLAVSRKILREHGGDILVQSELGKGSIFTLRLPVRSPLTDPLGTRVEKLPSSDPEEA
jgi:signal transduction histidine kinase